MASSSEQLDAWFLRESKPVLTFERPRYSFLSAGDVEAGGGDGIVGSALQALLFIDLLEQVVGSVLQGERIIYISCMFLIKSYIFIRALL